jgi:PAS domain S-box-containing protein
MPTPTLSRLRALAEKLSEEWEAMRAQLTAEVNAVDVAVITAGMSGNIISWNQAAERLLGWNQDEIMGQSIECLIPEDLREHHESAFAKMRDLGALSKPGVRLKMPALRKDGTVIQVEIGLSVWQSGNDRWVTAVIRPEPGHAG